MERPEDWSTRQGPYKKGNECQENKNTGSGRGSQNSSKKRKTIATNAVSESHKQWQQLIMNRFW